MCAPAEVGLLGAGNAWDHGFRVPVCTQGLAVLRLSYSLCLHASTLTFSLCVSYF